MNFWSNECRGFTILESLLVLSILIVICNMIVFVLFPLVTINEKLQSEEEIEFLLFHQEIQTEMDQTISIEYTASSFTLLLKRQGNVQAISYEKYGSFIRRRVNGAGHELVLTNVQDWQVKNVNGRLTCEVTFINGLMSSKDWFSGTEIDLNEV